MRNILEMSVTDAADWATDHPQEMQIIAQSYGICADIHEGYFCNLNVGHMGRHKAVAPDKRLIEAWGQPNGCEWDGMKES